MNDCVAQIRKLWSYRRGTVSYDRALGLLSLCLEDFNAKCSASRLVNGNQTQPFLIHLLQCRPTSYNSEGGSQNYTSSFTVVNHGPVTLSLLDEDALTADADDDGQVQVNHDTNGSIKTKWFLLVLSQLCCQSKHWTQNEKHRRHLAIASVDCSCRELRWNREVAPADINRGIVTSSISAKEKTGG